MTSVNQQRPGLSPRAGRLLVAALIAVAVYDAAYIVTWLQHSSGPPFSDFFGLWSFGRFARHAGAAVYDPTALSAYQHALDPKFSGDYPCPYPPPFLLALMPVGAAPLPLAFVGWVAVTFCAYLAATLGGQWRSPAGLALLVAPTSLLAVIAGQNGFLTAALLVGGLRCLKRAPLLAGVLFGLLAYKFQFGLMAPVVLLATRSWRPVVSGAATGVTAILATTLVLGPSIWGAWFASLPIYGHLLSTNLASLVHAMPTLAPNLIVLGVPAGVAAGLQVAAAAIVMAVVWRAARRSWDDRSLALALLGALIATPYAFTYDLPILTAAIVLEARRRWRAGEPTALVDAVLCGLALVAPLAMSGFKIPLVEPLLILALFARLAWSPAARDAPSAVSAKEIGDVAVGA